MEKHTLHVELPPDWYEVPDQWPHAYRHRAPDAGWLHVSLNPPEPELCGDGEKTLARLRALLTSLQIDIGEECEAMHLPCAAGIMAASIRLSDTQGLLMFWLIPAKEELIFAVYTMGDKETASKECADANRIVAELYFEPAAVSDTA